MLNNMLNRFNSGIRIIEEKLPNEYKDGGVWEVKLVKKFIPKSLREQEIAAEDRRISDAQARKAELSAELQQIPLVEGQAEEI